MNRNWDAAFAACKSYEEAEVSAALQAAIDAAGGLAWVTPGMRVALKLNLVSAMKPEQAATVHPAVVCALVKLQMLVVLLHLLWKCLRTVNV